MPRRRFIDPRNATTFNVVHRAQNDPLIHDENAPAHVFAEKSSRRPTEDDYAYSSYSGSQSNAGYRSKKTKQRGDLEDEFGLAVRKNEGEAAEHGIFYDDTEYDYMQHMRDLGSGEGAVTWVEANAPPKKQKGKQRLEDALRGLDIDDGKSVGESVGTQSSAARSLLPDEVLPSEFVRKQTYQDQQDVPDEIAGFQPDMDPRLREVLEALEDEEYVDDDEDDGIFGELTQDGYEVERDEWERLGEQQLLDDGEGSLDFAAEEDDGWESDDTIKASSPPSAAPVDLQLPEGDLTQPPEDVQAAPPADPTAGAWLDEFKKFKSDAKASKEAVAAPNADPAVRAPAAPSALESSALSSLATGRKKKRKGAKTETSNYSMTSSALARTDQQTLLDSRFDKIEEEYAADELADEPMDDNLSAASGMTGGSRMSKYSAMSGMSGVSGISSYSKATDSEAPQLQRTDFDGIMDEFLGGYSKKGKLGKRVRRGAPMTGMEQLDEVRKGLGPPRVKSRANA